MNRLPEKRAINFITERKFTWTPVEPEELTQKNWLGVFFPYISHSPCENQYSRLFAHIPSYRTSLRCDDDDDDDDDVFHHFITVLYKLKIHASLCWFEYLCVRFNISNVCVQLNLLCLRNFKIEMINFRYATTFSVGGATSEKTDMVSGAHTGCYGKRCYAFAQCQCAKQQQQHVFHLWSHRADVDVDVDVHTNISKWTGNWTKRK